MKLFIGTILAIIKLFIMYKVISLLYLTNSDPTNYPMEKLTWWVYFMVFEVWLYISFKDFGNNTFDE